MSQRAAHEADIASRGVDFCRTGGRGNPYRENHNDIIKSMISETQSEIIGMISFPKCMISYRVRKRLACESEID